MPMFQKQTIYQVRVNRHERMAELTRRAFYMAKTLNGPAQVNIPRDYFYGTNDYEIYPSLTISRGIGPRQAIVATDIGNNSSMANSYLRFSDVRQHIAALSWGNCGFAYGAAMGAKVGCPDKPVFAFQGDGAYGISGLSEVMTAVRENIPVIAIVANNHEWGAEKKNQIDYYGNRFIGTNLRTSPNYPKLAEAMGANGYRVEDYRDLGDVVRDAVVCGKPCVIDCVIQGGEEVLAEPFRRDALKKAYRLLPQYNHLNVE